MGVRDRLKPWPGFAARGEETLWYENRRMATDPDSDPFIKEVYVANRPFDGGERASLCENG